jgi:hypothetical protein
MDITEARKLYAKANSAVREDYVKAMLDCVYRGIRNSAENGIGRYRFKYGSLYENRNAEKQAVVDRLTAEGFTVEVNKPDTLEEVFEVSGWGVTRGKKYC